MSRWTNAEEHAFGEDQMKMLEANPWLPRGKQRGQKPKED
jgi:hypothetical protein